jgi:hypothetical protein
MCKTRYLHIIWVFFKTSPHFKSAETMNRFDIGNRRGRDRMVVGFTTTYAISAYHHQGEVYKLM